MEYTTDFKGFEEWNFHITTHKEERKCKNCTWLGIACEDDFYCKDFEEKEK